jgi:hypothetical protein
VQPGETHVKRTLKQDAFWHLGLLCSLRSALVLEAFWALQHSLGSILTFSMTDLSLQVITQKSGFGRTGAWLADRRHRMYELHTDGAKWSDMCNPNNSKQPAVSSKAWCGI